MQQARPEPMWMIVSIVERGRGRPLVEFYTARQMTAHLLCLGQGTASSEMLNLLGLGASEKDVLLSIGSRDSVQRAMQAMSNRNLGCPVRGRGVVFSVRLTGINALLAVISEHEIGSGKTRLKNACISLISRNQGDWKIEFFNLTAQEFTNSIVSK